ncbi:MAG: Ger(x)C family spore germination protein [Eubacterium sp.]|nr:Ger(x)C family spore germination protein [Eubacterium sp.]
MKSFKIVACVAAIAVMLTGCMNTVHLKDQLIVEGMGVDTKGEEVNLIVQTLKLGAAAGDETPQGNRTYNTEGSGESIMDAVSGLSKSVSKKLFFGQNKIIVFSREIAETDFAEKLDYFLRSQNSRIDVAVCVSDTTAKDIIESEENDSGVPCENMVYLLKNGQDSGVITYITVNELLNMYSDKTSDIYLPVVEKKKDNDNIQVKGIGLFSDDKLVYVTSDDETMGFLLMGNKVKTCTIEFEDDELGKVGVKITSPKAKKRIEIVDGNINFVVEIKAKLMIDEIENGIVTSLDKEKLSRICSKADDEINRICTQAFTACKDNKSDALRVGEYLAKYSPKSYEKLADDWDTYLPAVHFSVNAESNLKNISDNTQLG